MLRPRARFCSTLESRVLVRTLRARFLYLCFLIRLRKWNGISFIFPSSSLFFFFLKLQLSFVTAKQLITISFRIYTE